MFAIHELTILVKTQHETEVLAEVLPVLTKYSAKLKKINFDGTKRLAYKIQDHEYAGYLTLEYLVEGSVNCTNIGREIMTTLDLSENRLRYLDVLVDGGRFPQELEEYNKKFKKEPLVV